MRLPPLQRGKSWQTGTLVKQLSDKCYLVKTGTGTICRNWQFLKPQEPPASKVVPESVPNVPVQVQEPIKQTRSRIIKPPSRFKDFV